LTTYETPIVIGIFQDEVHAKDAVDALRGAGFRYDQVGVAIQSSQNATPDLQGDLANLGVPQEQAHYYADAYQSGNIVVSIRPDGRETEAQTILQGNGAYNYNAKELDTTPTPASDTATPKNTTEEAPAIDTVTSDGPTEEAPATDNGASQPAGSEAQQDSTTETASSDMPETEKNLPTDASFEAKHIES
jgi:hypothetical protein